ncbi:MAG TPA: glutathione S-transferase family protein [Phenylobacterium sp.]
MALTLYSHPLASFCHKVLIALYETGTPFEAHFVDLGDDAARAAFLSVAPWGKMPVLRDDSRDRTVFETSIIVEYLDRHYPGPRPLLPTEAEARLEARLWDRMFDLYVQAPMQAAVLATLQGEPERMPQEAAALRAAYRQIETHMADREWAAGSDFSLADCAAAPALFYAAPVAPFQDDHPALAAYFERLLARPSVARTFAEARPWLASYPLKDRLAPRFLDGA